LEHISLKHAVPCRITRRPAIHLRQLGLLALAGLALFLLGGCARDAGKVPTPTRTRRPPTQAPARATISLDLPTATQPPATLGPALTPTPQPAAPAPAAPAAAETQPAVTEAPAVPTVAPTAAPQARLTISGAAANARGGPGTSFPIVGSLKQGQSFQVTGKNAADDWWQVCCVDGQKAWVAASLVKVQNAQQVAVAVDLATPAVVVTKPQPTAAPAAVITKPQPTPKPAPAAAADPCANISGDGCKWKLTGGPQMAENGGREVKMQLLLIHSGIDGGQPQGGYAIILEKDGQRLPVPAGWRSSPATSDGSLGKYNFEIALTLDKLPGNTIAGKYTLWVLDGTGERDSRNINFTISGTQGLLWIKLDQA
jgi:SH3-like domain-containing protein